MSKELREAAQQALEVLRQWVIPRAGIGTDRYREAMRLLRAALAQPAEQGAELSDYPPLPSPGIMLGGGDFFTDDQMRAYVAADRAAHGRKPLHSNATSQPPAEQGTELSDEQIEAAAKQLAACMDYPWEFMPEEGRSSMRNHVRAILAAADRAARGESQTTETPLLDQIRRQRDRGQGGAA